ncbi:MAG: dTDP-glucose 4,6-dehydratase [Deltaproteobacteria bacterium]|nr:dTDP-glucose 4,6-dehydratase [Deltaproteobacteria bacterium]
MPTYLVTGGAGFIGSSFVLGLVGQKGVRVINVDALTYAGNLMSIEPILEDPHHTFVRGDIRDAEMLAGLFREHKPHAVVNFAAESHVDRSIVAPDAFVQTNVLGTFTLLQEARSYWSELPEDGKRSFRFLHVSTDEVYGSLEPGEPAFRETNPYTPNSPYSASKAAADHLVRAYHHTYGLPTLTTNCSNNYGPRQFPEKLIPLMILNALEGKPLPIYGDGMNVRDWLFVDDHCAAISTVLRRGRPGETYNIGARCEKTNLEVVKTVCRILDELVPQSRFRPHESLMVFVKDRPGHDRRYAMDSSKIETELGWKPAESFESGLRRTILWYLEHPRWVESVRSGAYRDWMKSHYGIA